MFGVQFLCSVIVPDLFCSSKAGHKPALQSQGAENCSPTSPCCAQALCPLQQSTPGARKEALQKEKWFKIKWPVCKWRLRGKCYKSVCASSVLGTKPGNKLFFTGMHHLIFLWNNHLLAGYWRGISLGELGALGKFPKLLFPRQSKNFPLRSPIPHPNPFVTLGLWISLILTLTLVWYLSLILSLIPYPNALPYY